MPAKDTQHPTATQRDVYPCRARLAGPRWAPATPAEFEAYLGVVSACQGSSLLCDLDRDQMQW